MLKFLVFLTAVSVSQLQAASPTRAVQEELRRRNVYFGDINGRDSGELSSALERYQERKGFKPTGEADRDTLRSLGLLERQPGEAPPEELAWPEEPVLRSDAIIDVASEAVLIAEETGVAPESIAPEIAEESPRLLRAAASRETSPDAAPSSRGAQPPSRARLTAVQAQKIEPAEMAKFVRRYLDAVSGNDLQDELAFYADRVKYYNSTAIDRRIIERNLRTYYARWPKRQSRLVDVISYRRDDRRGEIHLVFRVKVRLKNSQHSIETETENHLVINAATEDPRIISIEESRVRS